MKNNRLRNCLLWALLVFVTVPAHMVNAVHNDSQEHGPLMQSVPYQYMNAKQFVYKHRDAIIKGVLGVGAVIGGYYAYQYLCSLINNVNNDSGQEPAQQPNERPNGPLTVVDMSIIASIVQGVDMTVLRHQWAAVNYLWWQNDNELTIADGRSIASAAFWNVQRGTLVPRPNFFGVSTAAWPPCATKPLDRHRRYMAGSYDASEITFRLVDNEYGLPINDVSLQLTGHNAMVSALDFSPAVPLLASCSEDGELRLWNCENCANVRCVCVRQLHNEGVSLNLQSLRFNSNGTMLAVGSAQGVVYVMNVQELLRQFAINQ